MLEDIAILTGGQVIAEELGIKLENVTLEQLGRAKRVVVDKDNTTIIGGAGDKASDRGARAADPRARSTRRPATTTARSCEERLAKLAGGVAVIRVGAPVRSRR